MTTIVEDRAPKMLTGAVSAPEYVDLIDDLVPLEVKLKNLALVTVGLVGMFGGPPLPCRQAQQLYFVAPPEYFFARTSTSGLIESETMLESVAALRGSLARFRTFKHNWDNDGAEPFTSETVASADAVVAMVRAAVLDSYSVTNAPMISPCSDGRISFAWKLGSKELWIYVQDNTADVYRWEPADRYDSQPFEQIAVNGIQEHIEWLLA